jgi:CCR4-NOT complex subunit CAF16
MSTSSFSSSSTPIISCKNLSFSYSTSDGRSKQVLHDINLDIQRGSRVLLIGPNGSSKSTILKLIAGKHLPSSGGESVIVMGTPAFMQTIGVSGVTFIWNSMWQRSVAFVGSSVAYEIDKPAGEMMEDLQNEFKSRRDELVQVLDINLNWRMHQVSDGERRRVQIMLGLLRPFDVLLADEITVDLDVLVRRDFMCYLEKESRERGATILYATHIFDGLDSFPTHLMLMHNGRVTNFREFNRSSSSSSVYDTAMDHMIKCRQDLSNVINNNNGLTTTTTSEPFGGAQGFVSGRLAASTDTTMMMFGSRRMDAYR